MSAKAQAHALPGAWMQCMQDCHMTALRRTTPMTRQVPVNGLQTHCVWIECPRWRRPPAAPPLCWCGLLLPPQSTPTLLRVLQHQHHSPPTSPRAPQPPHPTLTQHHHMRLLSTMCAGRPMLPTTITCMPHLTSFLQCSSCSPPPSSLSHPHSHTHKRTPSCPHACMGPRATRPQRMHCQGGGRSTCSTAAHVPM